MSREATILARVDLERYGVTPVVVARAGARVTGNGDLECGADVVLYAARGVVELFVDVEDALDALGSCSGSAGKSSSNRGGCEP